MIEFLRIEDRGLGLVAVFDQGFHWFGDLTERGSTFCLNEKNLRIRIANVEQAGRDASVERAALAELVRRNATTTEQGEESR